MYKCLPVFNKKFFLTIYINFVVHLTFLKLLTLLRIPSDLLRYVQNYACSDNELLTQAFATDFQTCQVVKNEFSVCQYEKKI